MREDDLLLRLHDRFSSTPGKFEVMRQDEIQDVEGFAGMVERFSDGGSRRLIPLTHLVQRLVRLSEEAPATRPGPSSK
jgi:hypothetical protein